MACRRVAIALALAALVGCSPSAASLEVQLVTDYAAVRDFDVITTTIEGTTLTRSSAAFGDRSYGRPTRVARFDDVAPGRARIDVSLTHGGTVVQLQPRFVDVRAGQGAIVTVAITRDCQGVACPGADAPSAVACLGGQCVDPGCSDARPELCTSHCAGGCGAAPFPCVTRACGVEGVCIDTTDDTVCGNSEICVADEGCRAPFTSMSDAGVADAGVDGPTLDELGAGIATHLCMGIRSCSGPALDDVSLDECTHLFSAAFQASAAPRLIQAEAAGTFHYDASFATACLAAIDIGICENLVAGYPTVCENALIGRVALGGDCNDTLECVGDAVCSASGTGCPLGTCVARGDVGASCAASGNDTADQQCTRGLRCVGGACATARVQGDACTAGNECTPGLFCVMQGGSRVCASADDTFSGTAGVACSRTEGPLCMRPLSCTTTCVPEVAAGAPCSAATPDMCPSGQYCDTSGACSALPLDGASCLAATYPLRCAGSLYCGTDSICHDLRPNGSACASPFECASQRCMVSTCAPPRLCAPPTT